MRLMIGVIVLMTVSVLGLSMMTPAGAELSGNGNQLEATIKQPAVN